MKTVPYTGIALSETLNVSLDFFNLKFKSRQTESNYENYSNKTFENNTKLRFRNSILSTFQLLILIIYAVTYLLQLISSPVQNSLIFQIVLILICFSITIFCYFLNFYRKISLKKLKFMNLGTFISACVVLILNDFYCQQVIFDEVSQLDLGCLPGIIMFTLIIFKDILPNYQVMILSNSLILTLFAFFRIFKKDSLASALLEIFLLLIAEIFQICYVYLTDYENRHEFMWKIRKNSKEIDNIIEISGPETVPNKVNDCITDLNHMLSISDTNSKKVLEKTILLLTSLKENHQVPEFTEKNLENIIKNLDEEDKIYIQQSWSNTAILKVRKREKHKHRISVQQNIEKFLNTDLVFLLKQISFNWNLDFFDFNSKTESMPISVMGRYCLKVYNVADGFTITEEKIMNFFEAVEKGYKKNLYHNAIHASDVLNSSLFLIMNSFVSTNLTDLEMFIVIISNLCHDIGHPGFTNRFLIAFQDKLALECNFYLDNDISVLENMHCAKTFAIVSESDKNIFENLDPENFLLVRKWIIELILATDMGKHFELISIFKAKNYSQKQIENLDCKLDFLKMIIKAADIGHAAKTNEFHMKWSLLISEEFFRQGDIEKESGKNVSMYCDRENTIIPKSQIGFLRNIALPLYENLNFFLASSSIESNCIEQIKNNISCWEFELKAVSRKTLKENQLLKLLSEMQGPNLIYECKSSGEAVSNKSQ